MKNLIAIISLLLVAIFACHSNAKAHNIAIAIHAGAGTINKAEFTPEKEQAYRATLKQAVEAGYDVLDKGGESLDAVTAAIRILEYQYLI